MYRVINLSLTSCAKISNKKVSPQKLIFSHKKEVNKESQKLVFTETIILGDEFQPRKNGINDT